MFLISPTSHPPSSQSPFHPQFHTQKAKSSVASSDEPHDDFSSIYDTLENMNNDTKAAKTTPTSTPSGKAATLPGIPPETVRREAMDVHM